jgi:hypothetical protein
MSKQHDTFEEWYAGFVFRNREYKEWPKDEIEKIWLQGFNECAARILMGYNEPLDTITGE